MAIFWLLALLLPMTMASGMAVMVGVIRLNGLAADRRIDLGAAIVEIAALAALAAFLIGVNFLLLG